MANVYPFRGLRYAPDKVRIESVVTQPYDKISKEMQERYYDLDPHNIIRIILGKAGESDSAENNVYTRAADYLRDWRAAGIFQPLDAASFLVYFQKFTIPGTTEARVRKGFIGLGRLEDYSRKIVFPHERTLSGPKQDRLQLLRHTRTHFEQIFMLYEDPEQRIDKSMDEIAQRSPDIEATDEFGVTHLLWIENRPKLLDFIQTEMEGKKLIIADGHHRYETALAYRDEMRATGVGNSSHAAHERMPMTFFNMNSPGLTILPTHRVLSRLSDFSAAAMLQKAAECFDVSDAPSDSEGFRAALKKSGDSRITIGACTAERQVLLALKPSFSISLDVVALHQLLIERCLGISEEAVKKESYIAYLRDFAAAVDAVRNGSAQVAFLLNPTRIEQMREIAYRGEVMPQKSTDFYPKVLSGLIMYSLDEA
jgi:uncharacterized protein (DUF1015 family)